MSTLFVPRGALAATAPSSAVGYSASATAIGGRSGLAIPDLLVIEEFEGGGPRANANLDPADWRASASMPYPGENGEFLPGLISSGLFQGFLGVSIPGITDFPVPPYPFTVTATPIDPEVAKHDPTDSYHLSATARDGSAIAEGRARGGGDGVASGVTSRASTVDNGGVVVASAEALLEGFTLTEAPVHIVRVHSEATSTLRDGVVTGTTELSIALDIAGTAVSLTPEGLTVAGAFMPLSSADGMARINALLAPFDIEMHAFDASAGPAGSAATGFELRHTITNPVDIPRTLPAGTKFVVTHRFGETSASVLTGAAEDIALPPTGAAPFVAATDIVSNAPAADVDAAQLPGASVVQVPRVRGNVVPARFAPRHTGPLVHAFGRAVIVVIIAAGALAVRSIFARRKRVLEP
jgi:hypothetical protein